MAKALLLAVFRLPTLSKRFKVSEPPEEVVSDGKLGFRKFNNLPQYLGRP